ncbi:RDD family protein [Helicobacter canis]|uniref:RDD family protein n=1 Tax=Helicobacter canis TaxID=29419 RepID=UPI0026EF1AFC|nr:RDD family protein [Helicobacter canis]
MRKITLKPLSPALGATSSLMSNKPVSSKPRFRTIKKLHKQPQAPSPKRPSTYSAIAREIFVVRRLKALLVDIFMIYTPILYCTYWILGSAQEFRQSQLAIALCFGAYAGICALFIAKSGQTPGLRYVRLKLVDKRFSLESSANAQVGFWRAFVRIFVWAFSYAIVIGLIVPFISKSHQCLHDGLMHTKVIDVDDPTQNA